MITIPNTETQTIFEALTKGKTVQVSRPCLNPVELVPEFVTGCKVLWSIVIKYDGVKCKRVAGTLEMVKRWVL